MPDFKWVGNHIEIEPPKRTKKLTGTRFATVLGLNPWATDFEIWCEVTKVYQKPFIDNIYVNAGKVIEPKQAEYMKQAYFMRNLITPTDVYGEDYFKKTFGDFFPDSKVMGGMWDYLLVDKNGKPTTVLEMKTSKRVEDWAEDIPEYYALQAALYAYLLGVDEVIMVASFLEETDYENPESFVPSAKNTITRPFKVSERYPQFEDEYIKPAMLWWSKCIETGISPDFDEKKDAEILKELRKTVIDSGGVDEEDLMAEAEELKAKIDSVKKSISDDEKRLKVITDHWKDQAISSMAAGYKTCEMAGKKYIWTVSKKEDGMELDTEAMKADGVYDKYLKPKAPTYTMLCKAIKK